MKIKKIAIMHPTFGYNGGAENVILATVKHFYEKYNIECTIYTYKLRENVPDYIKQIKTDITLNPFIFRKTANFLAYQLKDYDAILIHNFPATIFFGLVYKYAKKNSIKLPKSFWYCHEPSVRLYGEDDESYKSKQKTLDFIARYTIKLDRFGVSFIDYIMANSERTSNSVKRVYNRESKIIYPCVTGFDYVMNTKKAEHFFYVGRLEKVKNLENAIIAFKRLLERIDNKDLKFIIAGKGRYEEKLKKLVSSIGMNKNIIFVGFVSDEEKKDLLNRSYSLIMPAINEPFGLTVIEALYCSCISIISKYSGVYEVAKDCSISCDMNNTNDITNAMYEVYINNDNIKRKLLSNDNILSIFKVDSYCLSLLEYIENHL